MSHFSFPILAFSTNFCPIKIDMSGNTVCSSLRSQFWMIFVLWFSNTVRKADDDLGTVVGTESCFSPFFSFHALSPLSYELLLLNNNGPWASTSTHRTVINHKRSVAFCNSTRRSPDLAIELHTCVCVCSGLCLWAKAIAMANIQLSMRTETIFLANTICQRSSFYLPIEPSKV